MKKIISVLLAMVMVLSIIPAFADGVSSQAMETALITVKTRVDIPDNFTEFSPHSYGENDKIKYNFQWKTEDEKAYIMVYCDEDGRIERYYLNDSSMRYEKRLTELSKEDILQYADNFVKKAFPEGFVSDTDCLVYDEDSWGVDGNTYTVRYERICLDREVKDNFVFIRIYINNNIPVVQRIDAQYDYETEFSEETVLELNVEEYKQAFPVELIYHDVYSYTKDDENKTVLVYRIKDNNAGYLSALDNEILKEDEENAEIYGGAGGGSDGALKNEAAMDAILTDKELEELESIESLISKEDADKILRKLPSVNIGKKMELSSYRIQQCNDEYHISIRYSSTEDNNYVSATLNADTGKVLSLYSGGEYDYDKKELTDAQKKTAAQKIDEFVKAAAREEYEQCKEHSEEVYGSGYTKNFDRYVNDVRYIDDGIDITYNVKTGTVTSYRLDFERYKVFAESKNVVTPDEAYNALLEISPVKSMWIKSGGVYVPCWTLDRYGVKIDALTGKEYVVNSYNQQQGFEYTDIKGHWAEEKIRKLAEINMGFEGENFYPDAPITQYDLLRFFAAGIHYQNYLTYPQDMLYENFIYDGILTEEEKNPDGQVLREDAFVYMVRLDGLEKVAKLSDIFKVEYADSHLLSEGKIGYPSILTGMNVICGNGGYLKPKTPITRAEAAVMVYNFMIS